MELHTKLVSCIGYNASDGVVQSRSIVLITPFFHFLFLKNTIIIFINPTFTIFYYYLRYLNTNNNFHLTILSSFLPPFLTCLLLPQDNKTPPPPPRVNYVQQLIISLINSLFSKKNNKCCVYYLNEKKGKQVNFKGDGFFIFGALLPTSYLLSDT